MADVHIEEPSSPSKTAKEAMAIMALTICVSIAAILLIMNLITGGMKTDPDSADMSEDAIADRLKPVGQVNVASAPVETSMAPVNGGEQIYNTACAACHATGVADAPKVGDKTAWKARIAQGVDTLYASAINGKNTMPPKGGAMSTSDGNIKAAVDLMVAKSR